MKERTQSRTEKISYVLQHRQPTLTVIIANVVNEHNVSAIYRTCDALGVMDIHLYYTHSKFPTIGNSVSASSRKWITTHRYTEPQEIRGALSGFQILATQCSAEAQTVYSYSYIQPTALLFGNEHNGVDKELLDYIDGEVYIPMYGMVQSFNVSVAVGILLSECVRQRKIAGMYDTMQLSEEVFLKYKQEWMEK